MSEAEEIRDLFVQLDAHVREYLVKELNLPARLKADTISAGDVGLDELVSRSVKDSQVGRLRKYHAIKNGLSEVCGWDAPPDRYDQRQYDISCRRIIPYVLRI